MIKVNIALGMLEVSLSRYICVRFWRYGISIILLAMFLYLSYCPGYRLLFSERNGFRKVYRLCGFVFKIRNVYKDYNKRYLCDE